MINEMRLEAQTWFEISAGSVMTRSSRIHLEGDRIDSDTRYDIFINSILNRKILALNRKISDEL